MRATLYKQLDKAPCKQETDMDQLDPRFTWAATRLSNCWAIRPKGALGTCGWVNGIPWQVIYVKYKPANIPEES